MEQFTLNTLGHPNGIPDWKSTPGLRRFQPRTQAGRDAKVKLELERMQAHAAKTGVPVDSKYLRNEKFEHETSFAKYPKPDFSIAAEGRALVGETEIRAQTVKA